MDKLKRTLPIVVLVALCAVIACTRVHTYNEPLERDLTTYAVIAHEMLAGKALYRDLWDHKPPAIHLTYAAAELIASYGRDSIFLMNVVSAIVTLLACYWAGSAAGGGRVGGCFAAALWTLASGSLALQGNQPNTEVFINAFLTAGFAIIVRQDERALGLGHSVIAGLMFAMASLYKQIAIVPVATLVVAYCISFSRTTRGRAVRAGFIIGIIGLVSWLAVFSYFFARGSGDAFIDAVFRYNAFYSSRAAHDLFGFWQPVSFEMLAILVAMASLSVAGGITGLIVGPRRRWVLLGAFGIGIQIAILLPGWFFCHYYQLWLPVLAIGGGWAAASIRRLSTAARFSLGHLLGAAACLILIVVQLPNYSLPGSIWSVRKYGTIFLSSDKLAYRINTQLKPGATFYEWGNETGLYFTTQRSPPSGILFSYPMLGGPLVEKLTQHLINDLEQTRPDLVVLCKQTVSQTPSGHPVLTYLHEHYYPFYELNEFLLLARRGSEAETADEAARPN